MKKEQKFFLYNLIISIMLVFILSLFFSRSLAMKEQQFNIKLQQQQSYYNAQIQNLTELLNSETILLQNLISNVDKENKKRSKDLLDLISKVEAESKQSIQTTKSEIEKQIATIETSGADFSKVIQSSIESVVSVLTDQGQGSGAIINDDGTIVTNYHVIEGARVIKVLTHDKIIHKADVVGYDGHIDIAVLKIGTNETFKSLSFGNSNSIKIGESVVALGNPFGLDFTATQGIVSARRTASNGIEYIQLDVPINPGNSGGPIIDAIGDIIGIANFKISGAEGIGFAIPSNTVKEVVDEFT